MMSMFGFKVEFAFLFMAAFLITVHCSQDAEYDDDFDDEGNIDNFGKSDLKLDDMDNEDAQSLDLERQYHRRLAINRRRAFIVDRRRRSGRRRWRW